MSIRTLSTKLNELAKELEYEVKDEYGVEIEFRFSSENAKNDLSSYIKVIITEHGRDIGLVVVHIDLDAPLSETLLYIKNRFNTTKALEFYKKSYYSLKDIKEYVVNDISTVEEVYKETK